MSDDIQSIDTPFPPQMLVGIAAGLEPAEEVAARFGYSSEEYRALSKTRAFQQALAKVAAAMDASGLSPEMVELSLLQEMTAKVTRRVFSLLMSPAMEPADLARLANLLYTRENSLAERVRKMVDGDRDESVSSGPGFVINISLPTPDGGRAVTTITAPARSRAEAEAPAVIDADPLPDDASPARALPEVNLDELVVPCQT